ncbi:DNA topoisomerase III, partial [Myxococcota bacterium]|nr:DNA topoisomerase III [Myxococcota bacterium]
MIFRRIYLMAGCKKPIMRLWASDMTEAGLKKALGNLHSGESKRNLGLAAFARAEADWLVGMNYSRLFTLKSGDLITVGPVQTPVLKLLVDRGREVREFVPRDYWTIDALLGDKEEPFKAQWHELPELKESKIFEEARAREILEKCQGNTGTVDSVTKKDGTAQPPLLYDLTSLQREANTRHGFSAQDTLNIAQKLYERHKIITYPRTDSKHLTGEIFAEILNHLRAAYGPWPELAKAAAERVKQGLSFAAVNDKKVTDHHAIIPTAKAPEMERLDDGERKVYELIARRFFATFMDPATYASSIVWVDIRGEKFKAQGKIFKNRGWLVAEPWKAQKENPIPNVKKGATVDNHGMEMPQKKTKAPTHYTDATLLGAMETAGKLLDDEELAEAMKERGLGTPATRAQVIETLVSRKYVMKEKKKLIATERGEKVITILDKVLPDVTSPEMTGEWEKKLKDIEKGELTYPEFMASIRGLVYENVMRIR